MKLVAFNQNANLSKVFDSENRLGDYLCW